MHANAGPSPTAPSTAALPWYRAFSGLTGYHWFVLIVCWLGWLFDTFDQQLFIVARAPAMRNLMAPGTTPADMQYCSGITTASMMLGWATGGIVLGILGDRWGRTKTLCLSILFYSIFTGLSAASRTWVDFAVFRFLTGVGVGGTFAAAVSLIAEVMPAHTRPYALGLVQALAAIGNMSAACVGFLIRPGVPLGGDLGGALARWLGWLMPANEQAGSVAGWRVMFLLGIVPGLLVLFVMRRLKEPESWVRAKQAEQAGQAAHHKGPHASPHGAASQSRHGMGSLRELFGDRLWRRNVLVGITLALAGIMGLWGIGFWMPELVRSVVPGVTEADRARQDWYVSLAMLLFNAGAFVGTLSFSIVAARVGRRPAFAGVLVLALLSVLGVFGFMSHPDQVWWMAILLGFGTLTIFGGYSIYFPELFPTRLRATGVGFCYNTARYLAATAPFTLGLLTTVYTGNNVKLLSSLGGVDGAFRYAAITVSCVFVIGLLVLPLAPETKGKPLPE
jgi:MFS family permease